MSDNVWDQIRDGLAQARETDRAVEKYATAMATLLDGKLRHVSSQSVLARLKRELADFNIHTGKWRRR